MNKTALLFGATGLVGGQCLKQLLANDAYGSVVLFVRSLIPMSHPKLKQHTVNFDSLPAELLRGDDLYCCLGTTMRKAGSQAAFEKVDLAYPAEIGKHASANSVKQFLLVTSAGADTASANFYLRTKGRVEDALKAFPFHSLLIFRPSYLMGSRQEFRLGERIGMTTMRALTAAPVGALKKYRPIGASVVAAAMVKTAQRDLEGVHVFESDEIHSIGAA